MVPICSKITEVVRVQSAKWLYKGSLVRDRHTDVATKQRRYAIPYDHPKPDIASKPKTAEAVSNSRNSAFSNASKTTFCRRASARSLAWLAFLWATNLASERNASLAAKKSIILAAGIFWF